MIIEVANSFSRVTSSDEEEIDWLRDYLTLRIKTWKFGSYDVEVLRLVGSASNKFPTGFIGKIHQAAVDEGVKIEYLDRRARPNLDAGKADLSWLRDYQLAAVDSVFDAEKFKSQPFDPANMGRGILWLPTGSGKTEIAVALTLRFPARWLFLVHRTNLMDQAAERFEKRCNEKAGRIGEGVWAPERFTAATFQTVHARLADPKCAEWLSGIEGVIFDEGHTLPAGTFYCVAMRMTNAFFRIAMSGTPLARGDKRSAFVIGATGSVLYRIKPELLIDAGVLSRPTIRLATVSQITMKQNWSEVYRECVVRSSARNAKVVQLAKKAMKPCLVFVKELKHGKALEKQIRAEGMSVEFVWGASELERRKAAIHRLVHGDVDVLIASVIFNEGVDIPELNSVVIASGGKSIISALQRIGRGMRVTDDKKTFEVWDINDVGNKWLERHTRQRLKAYIGEGHETSIVE